MAGRPDKPARIYLDACVWIDWIQEDPGVHGAVQRVMEWADARQTMLLVSPLHMVEVLGQPIGDGDALVSRRIAELLTGPPARMVEFDLTVGETARNLRLNGLVRGTADAIHLAHAIVAGADLFFTRDKGFPLDTTIEGVYVSKPYVLGDQDLFAHDRE